MEFPVTDTATQELPIGNTDLFRLTDRFTGLPHVFSASEIKHFQSCHIKDVNLGSIVELKKSKEYYDIKETVPQIVALIARTASE
jgi:hypothetical protein